MDPEGAADTIMEAIGRMSPDKREAAIGHFIGEYQNTMMNDDQDFEEDTDDENDEHETRGAQ